eukprot:gene8530-5977_t
MRRISAVGKFCLETLNHSLRSVSVVHQKLHKIAIREEKEEHLRDFLPPKPLLPPGWKLHHVPGSNRFDLLKHCEIRDCGEEQLHIVALMEQKQYEGTYRMDNGEREEQEYLNFSLFLKKLRHPSCGLEVGLTSIDLELVIDSVAVHCNDSSFNTSCASFGCNSLIESVKARKERDSLYRGPMLSELDDDLSDELLDYLDERGVNNAFAEYITAQANYFEQNEYLEWLHRLKKFSLFKTK